MPRLYEELCDFVRDRDAAILKVEARAEGHEHGRWRWKDGYRIDELVRELEAFRRILVAALLRYRETDPRFAGAAETSATLALHEFVAEIIIASVRQYTGEQQQLLQSHVRQLEESHLQAARGKARLQRSLSVQQRVTALAAGRLAQPESGAAPGADPELRAVLDYAVRHASLARADGPATREDFDPRALYAEIAAAYRPLAQRRGLTWSGGCDGVPERVAGDRAAIRHVLGWLVEDALKNAAADGMIAFAFQAVDAERWSAQLSASGLPWQIGPLDDVFTKAAGEAPPRQIALAITTDLINALGGSLRAVSRPESATQIEVVLPVGAFAGRA